MVDMLGAILDVIAAPVAILDDDVLIVDTSFAQRANTDQDPDRVVQVRFWVLPDALARGFDMLAGKQDAQERGPGQ